MKQSNIYPFPLANMKLKTTTTTNHREYFMLCYASIIKRFLKIKILKVQSSQNTKLQIQEATALTNRAHGMKRISEYQTSSYINNSWWPSHKFKYIQNKFCILSNSRSFIKTRIYWSPTYGEGIIWSVSNRWPSFFIEDIAPLCYLILWSKFNQTNLFPE